MQPVLLVTDDAMLDHDTGPGHPERPARLATVVERLRRGCSAPLQWCSPRPAPRSALERVHDASYLDALHRLRGRRARLDPDTSVSPGSVDAAHLAAGAAIDAVEAVARGSTRRAFALVRPPGHHAERAAATGFCLLNNVAIAAAHARAALGLGRVLIVDWDVHHGNGTQHSFEADPSVLFFSTHQHPFYPGTGGFNEVGAAAGRGFTVNVPLLPGTGDADLEAVFTRLLVPIAGAFAPELVLVSAGFDAHARDPLGGFAMTERGFGRLCEIVAVIADQHAAGRMVLVLEGGYDVDALAGSVAACVEVMGGEGSQLAALSSRPEGNSGDRPSPLVASVIERVAAAHRPFWPLP